MWHKSSRATWLYWFRCRIYPYIIKGLLSWILTANIVADTSCHICKSSEEIRVHIDRILIEIPFIGFPNKLRIRLPGYQCTLNPEKQFQDQYLYSKPVQKSLWLCACRVKYAIFCLHQKFPTGQNLLKILFYCTNSLTVLWIQP